MDCNIFFDTHLSLIGELYEYRDGSEADDAIVAERWLKEPFKLGIRSNIETLKAIIIEARDVLDHFDEQKEAFRKEANRGMLAEPDKAKAWLEKMIPVWEGIQRKLELRLKGESR